MSHLLAHELPVDLVGGPIRVVVIVPAYNEAEMIGATVTKLAEMKPVLAAQNVELSVFVIDDGSQDDTGALAKAAGADQVLSHGRNLGLGSAVRTGLTGARAFGADIVVKFDADLQHSPADITSIIAPILDNEADVVYGDRTKKIGYQMPFIRKIGNRVFTNLMRWMTKWPLRDSQPGIFAANRSFLENFWLPGDYNYTQQILLDAYHRGLRFAHVEVEFSKRVTGKSFISLRYPFKVLAQIILVLAGIKPMSIFAPIGLAAIMLASVLAGIQVLDWIQGLEERPVQNFNLVFGLFIFGLQTVFFGILAELIVRFRR